MRDVRTLWMRHVRAVTTLQQLLARRRSVMDSVKTPWERHVDAVGTLLGRCVHAITGIIDIFRRILRRPHSALTCFRTLYKRCGFAVWCDRGFMCCGQTIPEYFQDGDSVFTLGTLGKMFF